MRYIFVSRLCLVATLLAVAVGCSRVEGTGRSQVVFTSAASENRQGAEVYQQLKAKERINTDPEINAIVQRVGKRLAAAAPDRGFTYEFTVFDSDQPNAWALPGGKVGIYTGILKYCQTEAGLATVIGHEIAHAIARHGAERQAHSILQVIGGVTLAVALEQQDVPSTERNLWLGAYGLGSMVGAVLPYSRKHETEADYLGLLYMAKAGYDPSEAPLLWRRFSSVSGGPPEWLSTHPMSSRREQDMTKNLPEALEIYRQAAVQYGAGAPLPAKYLE